MFAELADDKQLKIATRGFENRKLYKSISPLKSTYKKRNFEIKPKQKISKSYDKILLVKDNEDNDNTNIVNDKEINFNTRLASSKKIRIKTEGNYCRYQKSELLEDDQLNYDEDDFLMTSFGVDGLDNLENDINNQQTNMPNDKDLKIVIENDMNNVNKIIEDSKKLHHCKIQAQKSKRETSSDNGNSSRDYNVIEDMFKKNLYDKNCWEKFNQIKFKKEAIQDSQTYEPSSLYDKNYEQNIFQDKNEGFNSQQQDKQVNNSHPSKKNAGLSQTEDRKFYSVDKIEFNLIKDNKNVEKQNKTAYKFSSNKPPLGKNVGDLKLVKCKNLTTTYVDKNKSNTNQTLPQDPNTKDNQNSFKNKARNFVAGSKNTNSVSPFRKTTPLKNSDRAVVSTIAQQKKSNLKKVTTPNCKLEDDNYQKTQEPDQKNLESCQPLKKKSSYTININNKVNNSDCSKDIKLNMTMPDQQLQSETDTNQMGYTFPGQPLQQFQTGHQQQYKETYEYQLNQNNTPNFPTGCSPRIDYTLSNYQPTLHHQIDPNSTNKPSDDINQITANKKDGLQESKKMLEDLEEKIRFLEQGQRDSQSNSDINKESKQSSQYVIEDLAEKLNNLEQEIDINQEELQNLDCYNNENDSSDFADVRKQQKGIVDEKIKEYKKRAAEIMKNRGVSVELKEKLLNQKFPMAPQDKNHQLENSESCEKGEANSEEINAQNFINFISDKYNSDNREHSVLESDETGDQRITNVQSQMTFEPMQNIHVRSEMTFEPMQQNRTGGDYDASMSTVEARNFGLNRRSENPKETKNIEIDGPGCDTDRKNTVTSGSENHFNKNCVRKKSHSCKNGFHDSRDKEDIDFVPYGNSTYGNSNNIQFVYDNNGDDYEEGYNTEKEMAEMAEEENEINHGKCNNYQLEKGTKKPKQKNDFFGLRKPEELQIQKCSSLEVNHDTLGGKTQRKKNFESEDEDNIIASFQEPRDQIIDNNNLPKVKIDHQLFTASTNIYDKKAQHSARQPNENTKVNMKNHIGNPDQTPTQKSNYKQTQAFQINLDSRPKSVNQFHDTVTNEMKEHNMVYKSSIPIEARILTTMSSTSKTNENVSPKNENVQSAQLYNKSVYKPKVLENNGKGGFMVTCSDTITDKSMNTKLFSDYDIKENRISIREVSSIGATNTIPNNKSSQPNDNDNITPTQIPPMSMFLLFKIILIQLQEIVLRTNHF